MFNKRIITIAVALSVMCSERISAQTEMSLHDCMKYAVTNSTRIKIQQIDMSDARANRSNAYAEAFTPSVNANTYASFNFGRAVDPETNTYKSIQTFNNGYSLNAHLNIFDGFRAINNIKVTRTAIMMGMSREQQIKDEICLEVMQAYYNVVYASYMQDVCSEMVTTAEENVHLVKRQEQLGEKSYNDVVHMEAELARRKYELTDINSLYQDAMTKLKNTMMWQIDKDLNIVMSLDDKVIDNTRTYNTTMLLDKALKTMPAISIAKYKMDNAKRKKHISFAEMLPTLSFQAGWNTSYYTYQGLSTSPFSKQFKDNSGEYIQFNLSIPLFNGLSARTRYIKAKNEQRRAKAEYEQTKHDVECEVMRAVQEKQQAKASFIQSDKLMSAQSEAYRMDKSKMQKGLISPIEFKTSSDSYLKAKAERINALLKYYLKRSVVEFYNGVSYIEQIN